MIIRSARKTDLDALTDLDHGAFGSGYSRLIFRQFLDLDPDLLVVAEDGVTITGYALGARAKGGSAWLLSVAVASNARGQGLGKAVLAELLDRLDALDLTCAFATVKPTNTASLALLSALGFREAGREDDWFGPGEPRLLMQRERPAR